MENPLTQKMEDCLKAQKEKSCKSFDLQDSVRREREIEYYNEIDHNRL